MWGRPFLYWYVSVLPLGICFQMRFFRREQEPPRQYPSWQQPQHSSHQQWQRQHQSQARRSEPHALPPSTALSFKGWTPQQQQQAALWAAYQHHWQYSQLQHQLPQQTSHRRLPDERNLSSSAYQPSSYGKFAYPTMYNFNYGNSGSSGGGSNRVQPSSKGSSSSRPPYSYDHSRSPAPTPPPYPTPIATIPTAGRSSWKQRDEDEEDEEGEGQDVSGQDEEEEDGGEEEEEEDEDGSSDDGSAIVMKPKAYFAQRETESLKQKWEARQHQHDDESSSFSRSTNASKDEPSVMRSSTKTPSPTEPWLAAPDAKHEEEHDEEMVDSLKVKEEKEPSRPPSNAASARPQAKAKSTTVQPQNPLPPRRSAHR